MKNIENNLKNKKQIKNEEQNYGDEQFQTMNGYYGTEVDRQFQIDFNSYSYKQIQSSTTKMRIMMKKISKKLDEKIHKYYGLMGVKHKFQQKSKQKIILQMQNQRDALNKLVNSQIRQIKLIQELDKQMASNKRTQKQAERLKQYFETKAAMIQAQRQTKYSKGQVSKFGEYLARDLDLDKQYLKFSQIKQNLQHTILKDQDLIKKQKFLQQKIIEFQIKLKQIDSNYQVLMIQAKKNNIILSDNKETYQNYMNKKSLFQKRNQLKSRLQILKSSHQSSFYVLASQVQALRLMKTQRQTKLSNVQIQIDSLSNQISSKLDNLNHQNLNKKIQMSMSIKNIDSMLKSKRQKNSTVLQNDKQKLFNKSLDLTQSKILSRPNFKIKHILLQNRSTSKNNIGKSLDLKTIIKNNPQDQFHQKRILKWKRDQIKIRNIIPIQTRKSIQRLEYQNPQLINPFLHENAQINQQ